MFSRLFLLDLAERVVSTFVQAFAASLVVTGLDDWKTALAVGAGAGVLAVAKSLGALKIGSEDSASLLPASVNPPAPEAEAEARRNEAERAAK